MKIAQEKREDVTIFLPEEDVNITTSPELRKAFDGVMGQGVKKILIDFSKVPYIDSSGLATLVELLQRLRKVDGKLKICSLSSRIVNVFEITKLHKLFDIVEDKETALKSF